MATSPTSYLQTLANNEAIAFVASLQKVKDHLSQELQWLSEQVQQKTSQIQGIETLLSEAATLGLIDADDVATAPTTAATPPTVTPSITPPEVSPVELSEAVEPAATNGSTSPEASTDSLAAAIAALPVKAPPTRQQRGRQSKQNTSKTPRGPKPSTTSASKAKPSQPSTPKTGQRGKASDLQRFLQNQFRGQSLTESVGEILNRASTPLTADDVMAELYDGLSKSDYQRAKNSVTNILSVGRSKGAWKSTGRGRYAANSVAAS